MAGIPILLWPENGWPIQNHQDFGLMAYISELGYGKVKGDQAGMKGSS